MKASKSMAWAFARKSILVCLAFSMLLVYFPPPAQAAIGDEITYSFRDLPVNYPADPGWDPSGLGSPEFQYEEIQPIGLVAHTSASSGMVTYRTAQTSFLKFKFYVPETGRYALNLRAFKNIAGGIADIYINDELIGEFDFYDSSISRILDVSLEQDELVLTKGHHTLHLEIKGKNPSNTYASYYYMYVYDWNLELLESLPDPSAEISPEHAAFDKNPEVAAPIEVELTTKGNTLTAISHHGVPLTHGIDYERDGDTITLFPSYLSNLPFGNTSLTFEFDSGTNPVLSLEVLDSSLPPSEAELASPFALWDKSATDIDEVTVSMDVYHNELSEIRSGETFLSSKTDYFVAGDTVLFQSEYLTSLPTGETLLQFVFTGGQVLPFSIFVTDSNPATANLAPNPSFEEDADENGTPDSWIWGRTGNGTWEWDETVKRSGDKSIKLTLASPTDRSYFFHQYIPVKPGATYDFSSYYKTEDMAGQPFMQLTWFTENRGFIEARRFNLPQEADDWQLATQIETAPANAGLAYLSVQTISNAGTVWYDDVSFTKVNLNASIHTQFHYFDLDPDKQIDIPVTITTNGNAFLAIRSSSALLQPGIDFTHNGNQIILHQSFLSTLSPGNADISFIFEEGAEQILTLQVVHSAGIEASSQSFDKKADRQEDIQIQILEDKSLQSVRNDEDPLTEGNDYTYSADTVTISAEYLATLPTGSYIFYFDLEGNVAYSLTLTIEDSTTPMTENLLSNPGFESGDDSPDSWLLSVSTTGSSSEWDNSISSEGSHSVKLNVSDATQTAEVSQAFIPVIPGNIYQFSADYRTENVEGNVHMIVDWFSEADHDHHLDRSTIEGLTQAIDWQTIFHKEFAPDQASFATVSFQLTDGTGTVWFDNSQMVNANLIRNPSFEWGQSAPDSWTTDLSVTGSHVEISRTNVHTGQQAVALTTQSPAGEASIRQEKISVVSEKLYNIQARYQLPDNESDLKLKLSWYDEAGTMLRSDEAAAEVSSDWNMFTVREWAPLGASDLDVRLTLQGGPGQALVDDVEVSQILVDSAGNLVPVSEVEDITEVMTPEEFWPLMQPIHLEPKTESAWTIPAIRNFYFGPTEQGQTYTTFRLPQNTLERDQTIPVIEGALGEQVDPGMPLVVAGDIPFNPIMKNHGTYSSKYYPRRMHDYISREYNPSYVLTGDERFKNRAEELINFLEYSQWQADGSNAFTSEFYPDEYELHPEWAGGWDYLFDWEWLDGYRYRWSLHEPDHHVGAQIATTLVNSYEIYGDERYLEMAKDFLINQIPRYGFHTGTWNNERYYWTEYNPTGTSEGHRADDATDNVIGLVAAAAAKVGYYETDPELKAQLLEYARGLIWYLIREYELDGRWFYDGFENQINPNRFSISHDSAVIIPIFNALPYLYKAGVDISSTLDTMSRVEHEYTKMWAMYQRKEYMKLVKMYDGNPEPDETLTFSSFVQVTGEPLEQARFQDFISDDFIRPEALDVRISKLLPPESGKLNWSTDPGNDVVLTVTPDQLEEGIIIPFELETREAYKISYDLQTKSDFDRQTADDTDSALFTWQMNENNEATFVRLTSASSGDAAHAYTLPLSLETNITTENFMSYGARFEFRIEGEADLLLVESAAPDAVVYEHDDQWGIFHAERYIYPIQSVLPSLDGEAYGGNDAYGAKGKRFGFQVGDDVELAFDVYRPLTEYKVFAHFSQGRDRGIAEMSIDGIAQGDAFDLYRPSSSQQNIPHPILVDMGTRELNEGSHTLRYTIAGQNSLSAGLQIGLYEALVLEPLEELPEPAEPVTVESLQQRILDFAADGAFASTAASRALTVHLTAVRHFEKQGAKDKVTEHMEGFIMLLNHQRETASISEQAYEALMDDVNAMMESINY